MTSAELPALRETLAFADFAGDLPALGAGEIEALGRFLRVADALNPALEAGEYHRAATAAGTNELAAD